MPQVPTYNGAGVAPSSQPGGGFAAPQAANAAPQQMQQLGDAGMHASAVGANIVSDIQMMANQVRVDAALNAVRQQQMSLTYDPEHGYLAKKGAAALDPDPLERSLPQQYGEQFNDAISKAAAGLANDAQRRVFGQQAAALHTQFVGGVENHMLQEYRNFGMETQQGTIKLAADAAKLNWSDPDVIGTQIKSAQAAVWKAGQIAGEPGNLTAAKIKDTTSAIHAGVIQAALDNNNPEYALGYIESKKGEMTADDLLKANGIIKADVRARVATSTAQSAMDSLNQQFVPSDTDRILRAAGAVDHTSGGGATLYAQKLTQKYGGDSTKVLAAMGAIGEEAVDAAVKSAGPGADWTAKLSPADQGTLAESVKAYAASGVARIPSQQDVHDAIRQRLGANADPKVLAAALAEGARLYSDFTNNRKVQGENAVIAAQQWLLQSGGSLSSMPSSLRAAVVQYAPDKYDNLIDFGKKIVDQAKVKTNMAAYLDAVANTDELAKMPQSVFNDFVQRNFSSEDGKHIAALRQSEIDGGENTGAGALNRPALNMALNSRLEAIGINPTPKSLDEKARVGSIQKFVTDGIFAQQKQLGRKMTAQEVSEYVDQTMSRNVAFRNTFLGITTGSSQQSLMALRVSDIPSESLAGIRAALARAGNMRPTDDQILRTYWTSKNGK